MIFAYYTVLLKTDFLAGKHGEATQYVMQLISERGLASLQIDLAKLRTDYSASPVNVDLILPLILESAQEAIMKIERTYTEQMTNQNSPANL